MLLYLHPYVVDEVDAHVGHEEMEEELRGSHADVAKVA